MKKITIVIPFLNEGDEPLKTTINLNESANTELFDIILIQDSPGKLPFTVPPEYKNVKVVINEERQGVCGARMTGVALAETPYILLTDAHMRFDKNDWLEKTIAELEANPKTLFCCVTKGVTNDVLDHKTGGGYGCYILMKNTQVEGTNASFDNIMLSPKWLSDNKALQRYEIPCVMGAYYAMSKEWFNYIGGLRGLYMWGGDEPCLSMKTWMMGGQVVLLKDIVVGHKYRDQVSPLPYQLYNWYKLYNALYIAAVLFPDDLVDAAADHLRLIPFKGDVDAAMRHFKKHMQEIKKDREEFQPKIVRDINWFCEYFKLEKFW